MDKLIKLLNEYGEIRKYNNVGIIEWVEHTKGNLYWRYWENTWSYMVVISKEYGFIKYLVENNRIDIERLHKIVDYRLEIKENYLNAHDYNSNCLLMLLSISDTPIDDLISYLK